MDTKNKAVFPHVHLALRFSPSVGYEKWLGIFLAEYIELFRAIYVGRAAIDEAQNIVLLKNAISARGLRK